MPPAEGLRPAPGDLIQFHRDGWPAAVAHAHCTITPEHSPTDHGDVLWEIVRTPRLHLSRPAYLYLLQGASLAQFIDGSARLAPTMVRGRLHLLRWNSDALWMGNPYLDNVVFAHVLEAPAKLTQAALITLLLPRVFPT